MLAEEERARLIDSLPIRRIEAPLPDKCVIAALESAFHAPATREEKRLRDKLSDEKDKKLAPFKHLIATPIGAHEFYKVNLVLETRAVTSFIKRVSTHKSPLGRALQRYTMSQLVIQGRQLDEVVIPDNITLVSRNTFDEEWHLMHAKRLFDGRIVSGNDDNAEITLREDAPYLVYQFQRKLK